MTAGRTPGACGDGSDGAARDPRAPGAQHDRGGPSEPGRPCEPDRPSGAGSGSRGTSGAGSRPDPEHPRDLRNPHGQEARARDEGRIYQASGDQHISEHHTHYRAAPAPPPGPDSVRRPTAGHAPLVLRDRAEVLGRLDTSLAAGRTGEIYVLHGMGGCGKTAVAHAVFERATGVHHRVGLWVNATDRVNLRAGMLAVAADRGAGDGELLAARNGYRPAADLVWDRLDGSPQPWLLVLDNADDPAILGDGWLRTSPRGTVLVTTRRAGPRWWPGAELQHIGVLPREDAALVLHDLAPHSGTLAQAADVADRLGRLPLALILAGGFLSHQVIDPWSLDVYGRRLEEDQSVELIDRGADALSDDDPRHLVGRTWQLTLDSLEARGLPEAAALLRLLARMAPEPLPLSVLGSRRIDAVLPRARAETALRALLEHSLAERVEPLEALDAAARAAEPPGSVRQPAGAGDSADAGDAAEPAAAGGDAAALVADAAAAAVPLPCVQCHGVLLDSVAAATAPTDRAVLDATATALLDQAVPAVPDAGPYDPRLRLLAPHVLALLRRITGEAASGRTVDPPAGPEPVAPTDPGADPPPGAGRAEAVAEAVAGALAVATRLVTALHRTGDYPSAWETADAAAALAVRVLDGEHRAVLAARSRAGRALFRLGRYAQAETLLRQVLAAQERRFGAGDPDTLDTTHGLLLVVGNLGADRHQEALALGRRAIAGRTAALGPWHPLTLRSRSSLLTVLTAEEARRELDGEFPDTGSGMNTGTSAGTGTGTGTGRADLGTTTRGAEPPDARTRDAEREPGGGPLGSLPRDCVRHLGADHTVTVGARHNHAWALYLLGRYEDADREIRAVLDAYLRRFGPDYPIALAARQLHARTQAALGHRERGVELMAEVVDRRARGMGADHPFTAASRTLLNSLRDPEPS